MELQYDQSCDDASQSPGDVYKGRRGGGGVINAQISTFKKFTPETRNCFHIRMKLKIHTSSSSNRSMHTYVYSFFKIQTPMRRVLVVDTRMSRLGPNLTFETIILAMNQTRN